ncbi:MAG: methyltransferase type 12 [Bilophila wadsworthia]
MTQEVENWTFNVLPGQADRRSEKQSPWYDMATAAVAMIARPYIPQGGKVYDLGCAAGNVGRVLAPTLHEREAQFVALTAAGTSWLTTAGREGPLWRLASYPYKPFDVAVAFLTLMDLPSSRQLLLSTLRSKMRPGQAIIIINKKSPQRFPVRHSIPADIRLQSGKAHETRKWDTIR